MKFTNNRLLYPCIRIHNYPTFSEFTITSKEYNHVLADYFLNWKSSQHIPAEWWSFQGHCSSCTFPAGASVCEWSWSCTRTWANGWCGRRTCRSRTWRTPSPPSRRPACRTSRPSSNTLSSCSHCSRICKVTKFIRYNMRKWNVFSLLSILSFWITFPTAGMSSF